MRVSLRSHLTCSIVMLIVLLSVACGSSTSYSESRQEAARTDIATVIETSPSPTAPPPTTTPSPEATPTVDVIAIKQTAQADSPTPEPWPTPEPSEGIGHFINVTFGPPGTIEERALHLLRYDLVVTGQLVEVLPPEWTTPDRERPDNPWERGAIEKFPIITPVIIELDDPPLINRYDEMVETGRIIVAAYGGRIGQDEVGTDAPSQHFTVGERVLLGLSHHPYTRGDVDRRYQTSAGLAWNVGTKYVLRSDGTAHYLDETYSTEQLIGLLTAFPQIISEQDAIAVAREAAREILQGDAELEELTAARLLPLADVLSYLRHDGQLDGYDPALLVYEVRHLTRTRVAITVLLDAKSASVLGTFRQ